MKMPIWCRTQASEIGDACREVVDQLLEVNALYQLRAAQAVLGLRKKYGDTRLEAACARAITAGDPSYRTIKGILVAGAETDPEPEPSGDAGAAAFLHGPQDCSAPSRLRTPRRTPVTTRPTAKTWWRHVVVEHVQDALQTQPIRPVAAPVTSPARAAAAARPAPTSCRPRSTAECSHSTNGRIDLPVTPDQHTTTRSCYEL
ncbi:hypothetical protein ACH4JS_36005 [Streptomyces sp. NPDC017638]|uniref:hypothetical protein n=1 Tax=Streptomyces sp. NPDC017638 TaxID=3365004 RepID=UPI003789B541